MSSKDDKKESIPVKNNVKPYGQVLLTLKNQLLPEEKLVNTPSQTDGLSIDSETDLRIYGCELIQTAGILLNLPQVAMATAQVLLQRFYYSKSFVRHPVEQTAMACMLLASKIEEAPRTVRDMINVFTHIRQVNSGKPIQPVILDQHYIHLKSLVIKAERRILKELGFCVHIKHPHKIIVMYLQVLGFQNNQKLMQYSWNYMNDSLRTDVFVRYQPETVACACIYLTFRKLKLPLPKNPHWFTIFGAKEKEIRDICIRILKLYNRPKPNIEDLEKQVDQLCEKYRDLRVKVKGVSGGSSPNNNSTDPQKTSAHNAWGGFISRSGSHMPPPVSEKRSKSRSESRSPERRHHKKSKKHRSRSRSPRNHKKSHKRKSYSRSRSDSPQHKSRKTRDRKRSKSRSNDRYIDRYEDKYDRKYDRDSSKYKDDRDRDRYDKYEERKDRDSKKYERDDKYRERDEKYKDRDEKYSSRDKEDKYSSKEDKHKKSKHRDRSKSRSKDRRRRS